MSTIALAKPDPVDNAIQEMRKESHHLRERDRESVYNHGHVTGLVPLERATQLLTQKTAAAQCSDTQAHKAAGLVGLLLGDERAFRDDRPVDGFAYLVRDRALEILEALANGKYGPLLRRGGEPPPSRKDINQDATTVARWRAWWKIASHTRRVDWSNINI